MEPAELLPGTLDLLILKAASLERLHGLGISRRIEQITGGTFHVKRFVSYRLSIG
jgi:PadR family transcriptional regulator PadR